MEDIMAEFNKDRLHLYSLDQLMEFAYRDCSEYSEEDLLIAWELFDRLMENKLTEKNNEIHG